MSNSSRVHAGVPTGGQFTVSAKHEPDIALTQTSADPEQSKLARSDYTYAATSHGRLAAWRHVRSLKADPHHDVDEADRIELPLLATKITRAEPDATHVICTSTPEATVISAVSLRNDAPLAVSGFHHDRPDLDENNQYDPLAQLARIANRTDGVFQQLQTFDPRSGWTVVALDDLLRLSGAPHISPST